MAAFEMEWYGDKLKARIQDVSEKNVINSARRVRASAFNLAPVDLGNYRESIEYRTWINKGVFGAYVEAGEPGLEHLSFFLELGTPGDTYGGVRKGARRFKKKAGKLTGQKRTPIAPHPHMRKALNKEKKAFVNSFKDAL